MNEIDKAVGFLNDQEQAIWSIPAELLPDYIQANPTQAKVLIDSTGRIAEIAAELNQWDAMERAVKFLVACQQAVLDWWGNNVLRRGGSPLSRDPGRLTTSKAETVIGFSDTVISRWRVALGAPDRYEAQLIQAIRRKAGLESEPNRVTPNSAEEEWYTPARYIEAARAVMGGIDLDPASSDEAQKIVQATVYFTAKDDGLAQPWHGRVWLNPPYTYPLIVQFAAKLTTDYVAGHVTQAIMLTHNCTDTAWFHAAVAHTAMLCFTRGRIRFYGQDVSGESPLQGQAFFYFGDRIEQFRTLFGAFGFCVTPV